jgi:hypothetical protein
MEEEMMDYVRVIYRRSHRRWETDSWPPAIVVTQERNGYIVWDTSRDLPKNTSLYESQFVRFITDRERAIELAVDLARELEQRLAANPQPELEPADIYG